MDTAYAGLDWASQAHEVCLLTPGRRHGESRSFAHSHAGLAAMTAWLAAKVAEPSQLAIAIEVPHGPVVEALLEAGFRVHSINPKQLDRFRDRHTVAGRQG